MHIPITPITREQTAAYYELGPVIDDRTNKRVTASVTTVFENLSLVLWEGDAYDAAGQWTDADAEARIAALLAERYGGGA